jgi:hypothetical protein
MYKQSKLRLWSISSNVKYFDENLFNCINIFCYFFWTRSFFFLAYIHQWKLFYVSTSLKDISKNPLHESLFNIKIIDQIPWKLPITRVQKRGGTVQSALFRHYRMTIDNWKKSACLNWMFYILYRSCFVFAF